MHETPERTRQKERYLFLSSISSLGTYAFMFEYETTLNPTQHSSFHCIHKTFHEKEWHFRGKKGKEHGKDKLKIRERKHCGIWENFPEVSCLPRGHNSHVVSSPFCYLSDGPFGDWNTYQLSIKETLKHPCTYFKKHVIFREILMHLPNT